MTTAHDSYAFQVAQRFRVGTPCLVQMDGGPGASDYHARGVVLRHGRDKDGLYTTVRLNNGAVERVHRARLCKAD